MSGGPHRLVLASAGTGKTYQLASRFLALLLADVPAERILATTFTRKAAGEILERVLQRLVAAADEPGALRDLNRDLGQQPGGRELTRADVVERLARLARGLDRFQVRTLDAFFAHLARLFALELGLPADWSIAEEVEDEALRREAIARSLERTKGPHWLALLYDLQRGDSARSVERVLLDGARTSRNAFLESAAGAWERVVAPPRLCEEKLAELRARLEDMELPRTQSDHRPYASWVKARDEALRALDERRWDDLVGKGLGLKVLRGEETFNRAAMSGEVVRLFRDLLREAAHDLIGELQRQNAATRSWLASFCATHDELERERSTYRFDDLPRALAGGGQPFAGRDLTDVWYRLDGRLDHLLLDEFQDTAPVQWRVLARLADQILADGTGERSFFCVGDVKQSIYGWREAEPRLLETLYERYPVLDPPLRLARSWRSSQVVLDTVNLVFGSIATSEAFEHPAYQEAARHWQDGFERHEAVEEDIPGAAWLIEAAPAGEGEPADLPAIRAAAGRAAQIVRDTPGATVGILLRRNAHIARAIYELRKLDVLASGEGGNPLTDSSAVLDAVALLHLADHPADSAAAFHVASSPLAPELLPDRSRLEEMAGSVAREVRRRLVVEGCGGLLSALRDTAGERYADWDRGRLDQLVDMAFVWERRAGLRPGAFVDHVRSTPVEDPAAAQVKVMTIHAAKGLEFDAVILPELDERAFLRGLPLLTSRPDPAGLLLEVSHSRGRDVCALEPSLSALRHEQEKRGMGEVLCVLYVAMTRARRRLDMIVRSRTKDGVSANYAGILRAALCDGPAQGDVLWAHPGNRADWWEPREAEAPDEAEPAPPPLRLAPSRGARALRRRSPSGQEGDGRVTAAQLLRPRRSAARARGSLVHRWLEQLEWLEDFALQDEELLALGAEIEPDLAARRAALGELRDALEAPALRALLSRSERDLEPEVELEVWRERRFAESLPDEQGGECLWTGAFDRVVLERRAGRVGRAELIDYKSDPVRGVALDARAQVYRPQVEAYRRVLCRMTGLEPGRVAASIVFLAAREVRAV